MSDQALYSYVEYILNKQNKLRRGRAYSSKLMLSLLRIPRN